MSIEGMGAWHGCVRHTPARVRQSEARVQGVSLLAEVRFKESNDMMLKNILYLRIL